MGFPVTLRLGPLALPSHLLLELTAYATGFALLWRARRREADPLEGDARSTLTVAAILGAVVGSKLVHWTSEWPSIVARWREGAPLLFVALGGKSVVGGLLGGTCAVELAKRRLGIRRRTGDVYVAPLVAAIAIGRVGCFLSGLADHTHGVPTALPWGLDLGDGVPRHPIQLYEIAALGMLALGLRRYRERLVDGGLFDAFLVGYLALRVFLDAWKPYPRVLGLAGTQLWALAGIGAWLAFGRARARMAEEAA